MSKEVENPPAFPHQELNGDGTHHYTHKGMTLRDYFAAKAMQGILANCYAGKTGMLDSDWSSDAYELAAAMLKARSV